MKISNPWRRRSLVLVLVACVVAIGGLLWLAGRSASSKTWMAAAEPPAASASRPTPSSTSLAIDAGERTVPEVTELAPAREPAPIGATAPTVPPAPAQSPIDAVDLRVRFCAPDGHEIALAAATITLTGADEERREVNFENASTVTIRGVELGRYDADVRAEGFAHRTQAIEVAANGDLAGRFPGRPELNVVQEERLIVWPAGWIVVIVRTPDGRPFRDLATDLGVEPKRLFVGAFDVHTRQAPPDADIREETSRATFRPPERYQSWELSDGVIGSLQLLREPPLWVGLDLFGVSLDWRLLSPGEREIAFELDLAAFDARCARLQLRVVDAGTRAPLPDARVTLRADTSAHRRQDQQEVAPRADGTVELERIIPGRYELSIARDDAFAQQRIELSAREDRDLGPVALEQGIALAIRVEGEDGAPLVAWVEIGPYAPGARVGALYPPMLHRSTQADGRYDLPIPAGRSVVRASIEGRRSAGLPSDGPYTANVLVDRGALPAPPLVLVVREPVEVRFDTPAHELATIDVRDELELVVATPAVHGQHGRRCELVPGRYRARFLDGQGNRIGETPFEVLRAPVRVLGP